jgi:hypothetical protein
MAFLVLGLGVIALLIWLAGPQLVLDMLARVGWRFAAVTGIYAVHLMIRAAALQRAIFRAPVRYADALRVRLSGDAVEKLTFTGPFLAEPAKGWLLTRRGLPAADAFAAVVAEYLLYTFVSALLAVFAVLLLLGENALPQPVRPIAVVALSVTIAFIASVAFAAATGIGLIVPSLRLSRLFIGQRWAEYAVQQFGPIERVLIEFLHIRTRRVVEVLLLETAAHLLLVSEIAIVMPAFGLELSWTDPFVLEGGAKFISIAFAFIPGEVGALEGVYALLASANGLPVAAGLTLALVRRLRGLLVSASGVVVLARFRDRATEPR